VIFFKQHPIRVAQGSQIGIDSFKRSSDWRISPDGLLFTRRGYQKDGGYAQQMGLAEIIAVRFQGGLFLRRKTAGWVFLIDGAC
jgi:hypothetical protein